MNCTSKSIWSAAITTLFYLAAGPREASAQTVAACTNLANKVFGVPPKGKAWQLKGKGVRVTWRGDQGFTSFTMGPAVNIPRDGFNTRSTSDTAYFFASQTTASGPFESQFKEIFPANPEPRADQWKFSFTRSGGITLESMTWDNTPKVLPLRCFSGDSGSVVAIAEEPATPGWGRNFWTFYLKPELSALVD